MKKHNLHKAYYSSVLTLLFAVFAAFPLQAQTRSVSGRVTGTDSQPLQGVIVSVDGTQTATTTNAQGDYSVNAASNATLTFSHMGYAPVQRPVDGRERIDVSLDESSVEFDDLIVVGYGTQRKGSISGSVASTKGSELVKSKTENPQNMLTGRLPGLRVWQKSAEPGAYNANFDIRGMGSPLVVIDGVVRDIADFQRLNAADIDDVSILKDASASIYGLRAANGVLLVTTKKGKQGKTQVSYNGAYTFQVPSKMPELLGAADAMTLFNELNRGIDSPTKMTFTDEKMAEYLNGTRRTADWNSLIFSNWSPQTQHDVSISGGSETTQYYVGMGYFYQEGFFKSGDLNYDKYNIRSNITTKIAKGLTFELNMNAFMEERHNPYSASHDIIREYWRQGVLLPAYADAENTMLNYDGLAENRNPVAMMTSDISGFRKYQRKSFQAAGTLNYDFGTISDALKGLSAKAMYSFDYRMDNNTMYQKEYKLYKYDEDTSLYESVVYAGSSPNQIRREFFDRKLMLGNVVINYKRSFGKHNAGGLIGWETQKNTGDNFYAQQALAYASTYLLAGSGNETTTLGGMKGGSNDLFETSNEALFGRVNYDYDQRYLFEAQFRYDGSSKFYPGSRQWGFYPSVSAGWVISKEPLFKKVTALSFINMLKVRASYGVMGDDAEMEYQWAMGYKYPATGTGDANKGYYTGYSPGYIFGGSYVTAAQALALPHIDVTWFTSHTFNVGMDFSAWNGLLGFSFDYFDRRRKGRFARPKGEVPTVLGAEIPVQNLNSDRHYGLELELSHRNKVGDFSYGIKAFGTITRNKYMTAVENGPYGNSYLKWRHDNLNNRMQGVQFGFEGAGRYTSWQDIWSYPIFKDNNLLPGDYKYLDWNGDGEIDGKDEHPYAYDQTPWMNYSFSFDAAYKNFDLSILLQGSALGSMSYEEPLYTIWGTAAGAGGTLTQFLDRWHPVDPKADIYDQSIKWVGGHYSYTGREMPKGNSDFNRVSTDYLRLKSIEIGYTIPTLKALPSASLRVYANAYNLLTFTGVKFVDPEHPGDENGRLYPLNKTYSIGVSLTF